LGRLSRLHATIALMKKRNVVLAAAAAGVLAYVAYQQAAGPQVEAAAVSRRDVVQSVVASGRIVTPHRVEVAAQVTATAAEVLVEKGDKVKAGQRLVVLESSESRAAEAQAKATYDNARAVLERNRKLSEKGFIGEAALEDAQRASEVARTQLEAARARLGYMLVRAPANGILITREVDPGDVVQPGKVLMVLAPARGTEIVLQVDERNLGRVRLGQRALASADAYPERRFPAQLSFISPGVDAQRGTVEVKLRVAEPPAYLRQDMTVSVDIEVARSPGALALPAAAVREATGGAPWVLRVESGRAERRNVELGLRGTGWVEIRSGLAPGEQVIPAGTPIQPGQRLRPVPHA
jgi:HlyD family secretion protein